MPYVIVGEVAAIVHGATSVAQHLEVCASLSDENAVRIIEALRGLNPKWRMRPDLPVVREDSDRLRGLKNMYLRTDRGQIDIVGELPGVGGVEELVGRSVEIMFAGTTCRVLGIDHLIQTMQFSGRDKDRPALTELKIIREKLRERGTM